MFLWDEVDIYQEFKNRTPIFYIGTFEPTDPKTYTNSIKVALHYKRLLKQGLVQSKADLARHLGVSRAKVTQMLNLLKLDVDIRDFMLELEDTDERLRVLTERRLRPLTQRGDRNVQRTQFWKIVGTQISDVDLERYSHS